MINQDKTKKYIIYAIGEIILVVIGILLALQINNWNENRKERIKEQMYLTGLKDDYLESKKELNRVIEKTDVVFKSAKYLLELPSDSIPLIAKEIDSCIMEIHGYTIFMSTDGTLRDLIGSGHLQIIKNDQLRKKIATWESNLKMIRERENLSKEGMKALVMISDSMIDQYNYARDFGPLLTEQKRHRILTDLICRNTIVNIVRNSAVLNKLYTEKGLEMDSLIINIENEIDLN